MLVRTVNQSQKHTFMQLANRVDLRQSSTNKLIQINDFQMDMNSEILNFQHPKQRRHDEKVVQHRTNRRTSRIRTLATAVNLHHFCASPDFSELARQGFSVTETQKS